MGSSTDASSLPDASSPDLILTQATPLERERVWALHHRKWGGILTLEQYIAREAYLRNVPLQKDGGITHWILTDSTQPDGRPILSSCDTYRKRALSCTPAGELTDGIAHGIGAVFTDPQYRGKGYASRMLKELGPALKAWQAGGQQQPAGTALFSILYSDIGKSFYAKSGWAAFPSSHLAFPALPSGPVAQENGLKPAERIAQASPIGYHEPAELCAVDEELLRKALPRRAAETGRAQVALVPDLESVLWHLMREDFIVKHAFDGRTPDVKGAVYGDKGKRVWAVWARAYYGEVGTLHLLRFVLEDEDAPEEDNVKGIRAVVELAKQQALEWRCREVHTWNPSEKMRALVDKSGLEVEFVDRDSESIASLMWYGGETGDVDWFYNEKFGWC
jgi:GNAT superfamily N-acetyltransferase